MTWHVSLTAWIYPGIYIFISFNFHFTKRADDLTKNGLWLFSITNLSECEMW